MKSLPVPGEVTVIGESQGFLPLHIRVDMDSNYPVAAQYAGVYPETGDPYIMDYNTITTYWEPTEEDRTRIAAGKPIIIHTLSPTHAPITVTTQDEFIHA